MPSSPLKTFIIYARNDEEYKSQLLLHLRPLVAGRLLSVWHDGNILPGEDWENAIKRELKASELVIVLVSVYALNSDFIETEELRTALDRLDAGLTRVIPIVVSPCAWTFDPVIRRLQALPSAGVEGVKPVSLWKDLNHAWASVVEQIGDMAQDIHNKRVEAEEQKLERQQAARQQAERLRVQVERHTEEKALAEKAAKAELEAQVAREVEQKRRAALEISEQKKQAEAEQAAEMQGKKEAQTQKSKDAFAILSAPKEAEAEKAREEERQRIEKDRLANIAAEKEAEERQRVTEQVAVQQRTEQERRQQKAVKKHNLHQDHNAAWAAACKADTQEAYNRFLLDYLDSPNSKSARSRIWQLRQANWALGAAISAAVLLTIMVVVALFEILAW